MKVLITGVNGQLGLAFKKEFTRRKIPFCGADIATCDITKPQQILPFIDQQKPTVLINCASYNLVDEAQLNPDLAYLVNAQAVEQMAIACKERKIKLVHYGTDYVFDGRKKDLYLEDDSTNPLNVYGESKLAGENFVLSQSADHLVLRTSWVYGEGQQNFLYKVSQWAQKNKVLNISTDEISVPTSADDLVNVTLLALDRKLTGLYHLTSSGYASRYELAKYFVEQSGIDVTVTPVPLSFFQPKVPRPLFSAMSNHKISNDLSITIPTWQQGVSEYVRNIYKGV